MRKQFELAMRAVLIVAAALAVAACKGSHAELSQAVSPAAPSPTANSMETTLRAYKSWRLVNPQPAQYGGIPPVPLGGAVRGTACTDPVAPLDDPHVAKLISVYVNEVGEHAMMSEANPRFPPGTIIVKEKRDQAAAEGAPVMMTVMVKHETGYAADLGDWEFLVMDGAMTKIAKPESVVSCKMCHAPFTKTDFVTRVYLPKDAQAQLR